MGHFFQDPFTGEDLIEQGKVLALSLEESVTEKLKAAISRPIPAIRDYYDLMIRIDEKFDLDEALMFFDKLFKKR